MLKRAKVIILTGLIVFTSVLSINSLSVYAATKNKILTIGEEKFTMPTSWKKKKINRTLTGKKPKNINIYKYEGDYITFTKLPSEWKFNKDDIKILEAYFSEYGSTDTRTIDNNWDTTADDPSPVKREEDPYFETDLLKMGNATDYLYINDKENVIGETIGRLNPGGRNFIPVGKKLKMHKTDSILYTYPKSWTIFMNGKNNIIVITITQRTENRTTLNNIFETINKLPQ